MPYPHHSDPAQKWRQQYLTTKHHILPFVSQHWTFAQQAKVLEIGCGEGGVLKAFSEAGFLCYGIDLSESRISHGRKLISEEIENNNITLYTGDVHDTEIFEHLAGEMDLIILKDAIEHIPEQEKMLKILHRFTKDDGAIFLAFPPWINPFGGHQQLAASVLKFVPWFHILPRGLYRKILELFHETDSQIQVLMEVCDTRLTTARFERMLSNTDWHIKTRQFFLFNPGYEFKFGLRPREQFKVISGMPVLRDFASTAVYYLVHS